MTSLFDVLAHEDDTKRTAGRQALSLAHKRVSERFDKFLAERTASDYTARLELIKEDFEAVVKQACEETGHKDYESLTRTLWNDRLVHAGTGKTASAQADGFDKEARRPKLCPYHSEVIDASLAAGEAGAGYAAMAQHAWGDKHCQSDGWEGGRCSFKPEMTTQSYWDEKKQQAEERREQRQQEREQAEQQPQNVSEGEEGDFADEHLSPQLIDDEGNTELEDAGVAGVPESGEAIEVHDDAGLSQEELMSVAASFGRFSPLASSVKEAIVPPQQPGAPQRPSTPPNSTLEPPVAPLPVPPHGFANPQPGVNQQPGVPATTTNAPNPPTTPAVSPTPGPQVTPLTPQQVREQQELEALQLQQMQPVASREATGPQARGENLGPIERTEVDKGGEDPIPKIDKRKWTPQNLQQKIDTEHPDSPHPTRRVDIQPDLDEEPEGVTNKSELSQVGENTTERQDVTEKRETKPVTDNNGWAA